MRGYPGQRKPQTEDVPSLDIRVWHRSFQVNEGNAFTCAWSPNGPRRLFVRINSNSVTLKLLRDHAGQDTRSIDPVIPLVYTKCRYGGRRAWFQCRGMDETSPCGRRVAVLYLGPSGRFACRECYGLAYPVQYEDAYDRALRKAKKLRQRLGGAGDDLFPPKPHGMHWKTYADVTEAAHQAEMSSRAAVMSYLQHLKDKQVIRIDAPESRS